MIFYSRGEIRQGRRSSMDNALYEKLVLLRSAIEKEWARKRKNKQAVVHSVNIPDDLLISVAELVPRTLDELKVIRGVGDSFIENYGEQFLSVIHNYLQTLQYDQANDKELEILQKLSNKLVNINQKNRLLYMGKISKKYAFDLMSLDEKKVQKIINAFISEDGTKSQVIASADKGTKEKEHFNELKPLYRYVETFRVEKGQEVLYLGYPFVEGRLYFDDFKIKAPLFLFPAKLEFINNEYRLEFDKNRDIIYNTTIILANNKFNNKNEVVPDGVIENLTKEDLINDAVSFFKERNIKIVKQKVGLELFESTTNYNFPRYEDHDLHLRGYCVLGAFPMFSNSIQKDYNDMIGKKVISPLVRNLFTGIESIDENGIHIQKEIFDNDEKDDVDEINLHYINALNYSQEVVLSEIDKKDALVIQGPPGTGKSQTITSLVSQAILQNKKVLIVSEKKTALDVIYNRLDKIANFVLYIDDPNNKETFYERLNGLLEFDDEITIDDAQINEKAIAINYELGKLNELEALLDTKTTLDATLRELYQNSQKVNLKDPEIAKLFKAVHSKKQAFTLNQLVTFRQTFYDQEFLGQLLQYKSFSSFESVYNLLKKDIKDTELQIPEKDLLEFNFFLKLYNKFGWFIKWQLRRKSKELIAKMKSITVRISGKQKNKLKKYMYQQPELFTEAIANYSRYQQFRKLYQSLNEDEQSYYEYIYQLSQKLELELKYINDHLVDIYTTSVIESYETKHQDILASTVRYEEIRGKIEQLTKEKETLTFNRLFNTLQKQIAETFNKHSKRLLELKRKSEAKRKWSINKFINEFKIELFNSVYCWLLTPEGISELLPLEENMFDLIIFDEASQMFIENAIPILFRGKKAVVAGDSKQLRPSKFAVGRIDTEDLDYDEYSGVLEEESLLDLAKHRYHEVMLNYHYRSRYEELIAFSNYAFYEGKLHVGPNAQTKTMKPIERIKVNGKWINRKNEMEADEVITLLKKIFRKRTNETIGIITFNATQKDLIQDKIDETCLVDSKFNQVIQNERLRHPNEQLFVKNIENVQGDERDIIIFSIGYAPNEFNRIVRQFGWLNVDGGENRLNVAISRAKQKVYVVTSIEPNELNVEDMKNNGPKLLRRYLEYVKAVSDNDRKTAEKILLGLHGDLVLSEEQMMSTRIKEDLFAELNQIGLQVEKDVGIGKNKLDLAIKDPLSQNYILGIEIDQVSDGRLNSTKEKDYHRQKYLETFGWNVHRVWCSDYWRNRQYEIDQIVKLVNRYAMAS